jgi:type IV pilus assembly protein PilM
VFGGRFSSSIGLIGIDWGTTVIRLIQLQSKHNDLRVVGAAQCDIPRDADGSVRTQDLVEQLRGAVINGGFLGRRCVVSIPRNQMHVQSIRLPQMPHDELLQAVKWEASQRFELDRESMQADYMQIGDLAAGGEARNEVLVLAAADRDLMNALNPVMHAGLKPVAVDVSFAALARVFSRRYRRESDRDRVRAVVEVGNCGSVVLVLRGDQVAFCKPISIGGAQFDRAVADHLELEVSAAAELRAQRLRATAAGAETPQSSTDRALYEAVRPHLEAFAKETLLCLRYFGVTFRGRPPERVIVTGGNGREPNLGHTLQETCSIEVAFDDELHTVSTLLPAVQKKCNRANLEPGSWAVAAGLSMRGINTSRAAEPEDQPMQTRSAA